METTVHPTVRALLSGIVDYAGLFPPAGLPMDEALPHFARYRQSPDAWMLARFVCPVDRLGELDAYAGAFADDPPFHFAVLGPRAPDVDAFCLAFEKDLRSLEAFHARHAGQVLTDVMEMPLPAALLSGTAAENTAFLQRVRDRLADSALASLDLFFEIPIDDAFRDRLPRLLQALAAHNTLSPSARQGRAGLKLRTGGLTPDAFPPADRLAFAITACRDAGARFKATAGLHHPLRRYHESVQAHMHGFLNLFGAAVLAEAHDLGEDALLDVLLDEDPDHFRFTDEGFAWRDLEAPTDVVLSVRRARALSFGSCSFDEPREDLQALGLL